MTLRYKTEGFVFKKEDNLDSNRIFSVFTREFGRVEVLGRAIRKIDSKLRGGMELFSLSYIEFIQGRLKKTLTDAVFLEKFKNIFEDEKVLQVANKISQIADSFIKGQESDEKILDLLVDSFSKLNQCRANEVQCNLLYYYFFWNFVSILGYNPELSNCADCQKKLNPYELYFSSKEGGVICKNCYASKRDGMKIKSDIVKVLRLILKKDWSILSKIRMENNLRDSLDYISENYYTYLVSNFKSNFQNV